MPGTTSSTSPVGPLFVAATDRGLARITFDVDPEPGELLEDLARVAGPRVLRAPKAVDGVRRELDEYFDGRRKSFDLSVDLRGVAPFSVTRARRARARAVRRDGDLRGAGSACRASAGGACRRDDHESQPHPDRAPLSPHRSAPTAASSATGEASSERSSCCGWRARCCEQPHAASWTACTAGSSSRQGCVAVRRPDGPLRKAAASPSRREPLRRWPRPTHRNASIPASWSPPAAGVERRVARAA